MANFFEKLKKGMGIEISEEKEEKKEIKENKKKIPIGEEKEIKKEFVSHRF
jgi:hypothetical protein